MPECFFCHNLGGEVLFDCDLYRIILVDERDYPGYLRVILNRHIKELSDLSDDENLQIYAAVIKCEKIIRQSLQPEKINLASFGNLTPHVHWHIIPRFSDDRHFPNPTWGEVTNPRYVPTSKRQNLALQMVSDFKSLFMA